MLLPGNWLATMQAQDRTFVDYLIASVLKGTPWTGGRSLSAGFPTSTMRAP
jgi:hypothetical protein